MLRAALDSCLANVTKDKEKRAKANSTQSSQVNAVLCKTKERVTPAREELKGIRGCQESLQVDFALSQVHEKIKHAEEAFLATSEAEMPFLKCLEVLPVDEGVQAAIKKCEVALEQARSCIQKVEKESKSKFSKEARSRLMAELQKCRGRCDDTENKLNAFRKEALQRKAKRMAQEVNGKVVDTENRSKALTEATKVLQADDLFEVVGLQTALDQSLAAEKEAFRAYNEARIIMNNGREASEAVKDKSLLCDLSTLQKRLDVARREMMKSRDMATKDRMALIQSEKVVKDGETKVRSMEEAVEKVEKQMPSEDQEVSKEILLGMQDLLAMGSQIEAAIYAVQKSQRAPAPAAVKLALNKLLKRVKEASERVEKARQAFKTQGEKASAEVFAKEAEHQVEAAIVKVTEAPPPATLPKGPPRHPPTPMGPPPPPNEAPPVPQQDPGEGPPSEPHLLHADRRRLTEVQENALALFHASATNLFLPRPCDIRRGRRYSPMIRYVHTDANGLPLYPQEPLRSVDDPAFFERLRTETLFVIFHFQQQGTYQHHLAARELQQRGWAIQA